MPEPRHHEHEHHDRDPAEQPERLDPARVEERDHDDGADVVDDRQRQQEDLQAARHPGAEDRQHPDRERDVGRHGDRPTVEAGATEVEQRRRRRPAPPCRRSPRWRATRHGSSSRSSPVTSSRLISSPTTKKKIVISASFTQCTSVSVIARSPDPMVSGASPPARVARRCRCWPRRAPRRRPAGGRCRSRPPARRSRCPIGGAALPRTGIRTWRWSGIADPVGQEGAGAGSSRGASIANSGQRLRDFAESLCIERDGAGVVVAGTGLDPAVADHAVHQVATDLGAHDGERPVVERADAAGGDVGVLGGEVGAHLAALARPRVALLERHLVVVAVVHPDLEDALDVHLLHLGLLQAVLGLEELLEDGVVERLGAQEPDVERRAAGPPCPPCAASSPAAPTTGSSCPRARCARRRSRSRRRTPSCSPSTCSGSRRRR